MPNKSSTGTAQHHFEEMTGKQRAILADLWHKIRACEGENDESIPREYWCDECKATDERIVKLFKRFAEMNATRELNMILHWDSFSPPGFSKPNST